LIDISGGSLSAGVPTARRYLAPLCNPHVVVPDPDIGRFRPYNRLGKHISETNSHKAAILAAKRMHVLRKKIKTDNVRDTIQFIDCLDWPQEMCNCLRGRYNPAEMSTAITRLVASREFGLGLNVLENFRTYPEYYKPMMHAWEDACEKSKVGITADAIQEGND